VAEVAVEPAETYDVIVGAGGAGAAFIGAYSHGGDGGDTQFVRRRDGSTLAIFRGAGWNADDNSGGGGGGGGSGGASNLPSDGGVNPSAGGRGGDGGSGRLTFVYVV